MLALCRVYQGIWQIFDVSRAWCDSHDENNNNGTLAQKNWPGEINHWIAFGMDAL